MSTPAPVVSGANDAVATQKRLVVLGASNVARGIATVVQSARAAMEGPFDLMAALGHGRSYGRGSWVLGRWLPGIVDCQLWEDLAQRESQSSVGDCRTSAVVTDVGNDILYGASTEQIVGWVDACVMRLQQHACEITLTGIPLESLSKIAKWEFPLFRTILYPGCFLSREQALHRAAELHAGLAKLADQRGIHFIETSAAWYGRDRIHITRNYQRAAWQAFFSRTGEAVESAPASFAEFLKIRRLTPHRRRLLGIPNGRQQPAGMLCDGTLVSLY